LQRCKQPTEHGKGERNEIKQNPEKLAGFSGFINY